MLDVAYPEAFIQEVHESCNALKAEITYEHDTKRCIIISKVTLKSEVVARKCHITRLMYVVAMRVN